MTCPRCSLPGEHADAGACFEAICKLSSEEVRFNALVLWCTMAAKEITAATRIANGETADDAPDTELVRAVRQMRSELCTQLDVTGFLFEGGTG